MNTLVDQSAAQTGTYIFCLCLMLICYGYLSAPNLYSFFYSILAVIFLANTNILICVIVIVGAACVPLTYHFLEDDYVMLNMLTYFPYYNVSYYYQQLSAVCVTWALFIGCYVLYFISQKNYEQGQGISKVIRDLRAYQNE